MNFENKNFIAAILLSMAIIFGWQYFYAAPLQKKLTAETQTAQTQPGATQTAPATGGTVPGAATQARRSALHQRFVSLHRELSRDTVQLASDAIEQVLAA